MSDEHLEWYYVSTAQSSVGPISKAQVKEAYVNGDCNESCLCWNETLADWTPMGDVPGLMVYLKPAPVAVPPKAFRPPGAVPIAPVTSTPASGGGEFGGDLAAALAARAGKKFEFNPEVKTQEPQSPTPAFTNILKAAATPASPTTVVSSKAEVTSKAIPAPPPKASGDAQSWVELFTPEGLPYYYNKNTKSTTWDKPDCLKTADEADKDGDWVWMPHPEQAYIPAKRTSAKFADGNHHVETEDGQQHTISGKIPLDSITWSSLRTKVDDLVMLDEMNLPLILHALKTRFQNDQIYTSVGTILISINPYKRLPLYDLKIIESYHKRGTKNMPPHVYLIADSAFTNLIENQAPQSIVISGESGAGKTECTKQALQYLAEIAGSSTSNVEQKILASNPILEAFGNAKTVRNNNSSRFGKYVEINFDHNLQISGSTNTNYLLEKIRVVKQSMGERNYHAFYQLIRGAPAALKKQLRISDVRDYWYLSQSGCDSVDDMDDAEEHEAVLTAMQDLGWSQTEIDNIYNTLAGILHLGNIKFVSEGDRKCSVSNKDVLDNLTSLLKLDPTAFQKAVTAKVMRVTGQADIDVFLGKEEAEAARDALAKFIYEKLFDWIVQRINISIGKGVSRTGSKGSSTISILDIFGFEIFEHNQFEQLCINFTNEKLQQFFNQHTFKKEEELYLAEGINFTHVQYIDNQPVLDLIEQRPSGILPMVDEEIKMPRGSDKSFMLKLSNTHGRSAYFKPYLKNPDMFVVEHYAGTVVYDSNGFLEKNRDQLNDDAYAVLQQSSFKFLCSLFDDNSPSGGRKATLGSKFAKQLNDLMIALNSTEPHYIRCVKANPNKAQMEFHPTMVLEQLRYSGVFEAVKIRKSGFPFRYTHVDFFKRFKCIMPPKTKFPDVLSSCRLLISEMKQSEATVQIGKTRILYRAPEHRAMELFRNIAVENVTIKIQSNVRGWLARRLRKRLRIAKPKLLAAMQTRTLDALDKILEETKNIGFELKELTQARRLRFVIVEEKRVEQVMVDLLKQDPERVYDQLAQAVASANDIELKTSVAEEARRVLAEVRDRRQARAWLREGVDEAEEDKLNWAIATVQRLRMSDSTSEAQAMVQRIAQEKVLIANMQQAMLSGGFLREGDSIYPDALRQAVNAAASFVCKTKAGIAVYSDADVIVRVRETLKSAQGTKDKGLWKAVGQAAESAVGEIQQHPEVQKACEEVAHQAAIDEICEKLEIDVRDRNQEGIGFGISQADHLRVDEVKYPIVPEAKIVLAKIIESRRLLDSALAAVDEEQLVYAVQYSESFNYEKPQVGQARQLRNVVMQINAEVIYALDLLEEEPMRALIARADAIRLDTADLQQLKNYLMKSAKEFIQDQLKSAVKHNDDSRRIRLTIKLKEMIIDMMPAMFEFDKYARLRSPKDWADRKIICLNREKLANSCRNHVSDTIHTSLTEHEEDPKRGDMARKMFKNVLGFMGDRNYGTPVPLLVELLNSGLSDPWMRDEIFCQVIKQMTNNNNHESKTKGSQLMAACLETFPPQSEFENYLALWIKTQANPNDKERFKRLFYIAVYMGARTSAPSEMECQRIMNGQALREINFDTPREYQTPQAKIPPQGQAVAYYHQMLRDQAANKEQKLQQEQKQTEILQSYGGSAAVVAAGRNTTPAVVAKTVEVEEELPPPPPVRAPKPAEEAPLPPNWQIAYSGVTPYYYNELTQETTWDRPY